MATQPPSVRRARVAATLARMRRRRDALDGVLTEFERQKLPPVEASQVAEFEKALIFKVLEPILVLCRKGISRVQVEGDGYAQRIDKSVAPSVLPAAIAGCGGCATRLLHECEEVHREAFLQHRATCPICMQLGSDVTDIALDPTSLGNVVR